MNDEFIIIDQNEFNEEWDLYSKSIIKRFHYYFNNPSFFCYKIFESLKTMSMKI